MILGLLGPVGTYCEQAALIWDNNSRLKYYDDVIDVVSGLVEEKINQGIIPIENSLEGSVGITLDLLRAYDIKIIGEVLVQIKHCLLAVGDISDVNIILSHPQAIAQCRFFIKEHFKGVKVITTDSTAHAAKQASESGEIAAIASEESAIRYNLNVLKKDIQDHNENVTRFIAIGNDYAKPTGDDKTSISIYLQKDRPGALYEILEAFSKRNINLSKIESRPSRKALGDYVFYIDCDGHIKDKKVSEALGDINKKVQLLKVLGSYPKASTILQMSP